MPPRLGNPDRDFSVDYKTLLSEQPLPPYELDSVLNTPETRERIGELIARAMMRDMFKKR